jgi:hypothetical protein
MADEPRTGDALRESPAVSARAVLGASLGFLVFVILAMAGLRIFYLATVSGPIYRPPRPQTAPGVQADSPDDVARVVREQRAKLAGYDWSDRQKGVIRIPIERAMALIAARGMHGYDPLEPPPPAADAPPTKGPAP